MNAIPLSDEENYAILAETFTESLGDLDKEEQRQVLKRVHTLLESESPRYYIYEQPKGTDRLHIIRAGDQLRIYCRLVMGIPRGGKLYNILYLFYIDKHYYRDSDLRRFDERAQERLNEATSISGAEEAGEYLDRQDAMDAEDVVELLNR